MFACLQLSPGRSQTCTSQLPQTIAASNAPNTPIILKSNTNQQQQQPTVKVVKVFSSVPVSSQGQTTATKPLIHIVPNPQGNVRQQNAVAADLTTPKVVSVQSLQAPPRISIAPSPQQNTVTVKKLVLPSGHKIHLQTPVSQFVTSVSNSSPQYQVKTVPVQQAQPQIRTVTSTVLPTTPALQNQTPKQISTPLRSPAGTTSYKPLESLQEVNRQATQATVVQSPVSAVIPEATDSVKKSPTEIRNQVTVSDRYRYIAPSPQTSAVPVAAAANASQFPSAVKSLVPVAAKTVTQAQPQVLQVLSFN